MGLKHYLFILFTCGHQKKTGFTLIETLVAMMVLVISFTIIAQLFSGGLKSAKLSDNYTKAIFLAKEKMEEMLLVPEPVEDTYAGELDNGFFWTAKIDYLEQENEESKNTGSGPGLFNYYVNISWNEGKAEKYFEISTIRLAHKKL